MHEIKRRTAQRLFTYCYLTRFNSLLVVTRNALLCSKRLSAFFLSTLTSERYFVLLPQQRKSQLRPSTK